MTRWLFILFAFSVEWALAYPQMISHGYTQCTACHYSPNGGGLMTEYGRSLSQELLSQTGFKGESDFLYGAVKTPAWLQAGGNIRALQSYLNSSLFEQARFIFMQADAEVGVTPTPELQVVVSLGYQNSLSANYNQKPWISRRHYLQYALTDTQALRLGRFQLAYGINWPDHFIMPRKDLGWDEGSETYNLEYSILEEKYELLVSATAGRPETDLLDYDKGFAARGGYVLGEASKVGLGAYWGKNKLGDRILTGPFALVTLIKNLTLLGELHYQNTSAARGNASGLVTMARLNYEILQGIHVYAMHEYSKLDLNRDNRTKEAYSLGAQWFFRPHLEISGGLRKQKNQAMSTEFADFAWLLLHYYL